MLLNRFAKEILDQNWATVFVELIIVVLGIYLGFQVTDWDEQRKLANQKGFYLERLQNDLQNSLRSIETSVAVSSRAMEDISYLEAVTKNPDIALSDPDKLPSSLFFPGVSRVIRIHTDTFDELTSSGKMNILDNQMLESMIIEFYGVREARGGTFENSYFAKSQRFEEFIEGVLNTPTLLAYFPFKSDWDFEFPEVELTNTDIFEIAENLSERQNLVDLLPSLYMSNVYILREASLAENEIQQLLNAIELEMAE